MSKLPRPNLREGFSPTVMRVLGGNDSKYSRQALTKFMRRAS